MDRRVTPTKRVTSPTWGPPLPCKQAALSASFMLKRGPYETKGAFMGKSKSGCSNLTKDFAFFGKIQKRMMNP